MTRYGRQGAGRLLRSWVATSIVLIGALTAGATAGVAPFAGVLTPAAADPISGCSTTTGVIVVVNFAPWGGNVERGCAADPATGYAALHAAGFTTAGTEDGGPAFVCRVDDEPPPAEQACISTPPASAYWSFWYANAGQNTWTYSPQGAMSFEPRPGSVDAWTFGGTNIAGTEGQPKFAPSAVRATNPGPAHPPATTATSITTTTTSTASVAPIRPSPPTTLARRTSSLPGSTPTTLKASDVTTRPAPTSTSRPAASTVTTVLPAKKSAGSAPTTIGVGTTKSTAGKSTAGKSTAGKSTVGASTSSSVPKIVNVAAGPARPHPSSGSPAALIIGAVLVAAVGIGGSLIAWRRRRVA